MLGHWTTTTTTLLVMVAVAGGHSSLNSNGATANERARLHF
jgi:hypothetical protein